MKRIPPALLVAFVVGFAFNITQIVRALASGAELDPGAGWLLCEDGVGFAASALGAVGAWQLAGRLTGGAGIGARIAAVGLVGKLVLELGWIAVGYFAMTHPDDYPKLAFDVMGMTSSATTLAVAVGIGLASRRSLLVAVAAIIAIAANPPWFISAWLYGGRGWSLRTATIVEIAPRLVLAAVSIVAATVASRETVEVTDIPRAVVGLQRASRALWLGLITALAAAGAALLAAGARSHGTLELSKAVLLGGAVIGSVAAIGFARGLLGASRSNLAELPSWLLLVGATASLWLAGVTLAQLPWLYGGAQGSPGMEDGYATALATIVQIVGAVGNAAVLVALTLFARRRGLAELHDRAARRIAAFVVLVITSIAAQRLVLQHVTSASGFVMVTLFAAVGAAYAYAIAANLCASAAELIDREPGLPTAMATFGNG